jgi:hypothetical protein
MDSLWSRPVGVSIPNGSDYWDYFGYSLVELAAITPGVKVLDVACGTGSSLFPAAKRTGPSGSGINLQHSFHDFVRSLYFMNTPCSQNRCNFVFRKHFHRLMTIPT